MQREAQHRIVTLEYPVTCRRCQAEIHAGVQHHVVTVKKDGHVSYVHGHSRCTREPGPPKPTEPKPGNPSQPKPAEPKPAERSGIDEEELAMMGATLLVAGASYLLGRWRQKRAQSL